MYEYISACYIEGGQNSIGRVTTRTTFDIMYSEMQMDYHLLHFALQYISNELNYIILPMVARLLKKQLISLSVQILNGIVLSLLSLVLLSYFHWKLSVLVFFSVAIIINVIIIFWHEYYYYP